MTKTRARYTLEFKQEAVRLVEGGQSIAALSSVSSPALLFGKRQDLAPFAPALAGKKQDLTPHAP